MEGLQRLIPQAPLRFVDDAIELWAGLVPEINECTLINLSDLFDGLAFKFLA